MQATYAWSGLMERMPTSKREFWFTLIRVLIVVALVAAAARLAAIAYTPPSSAVSQQLNCPPDVVIHRETVVLPQALAVTEQSDTSIESDEELANKSDLRSMIGKKKQPRNGAKKLPTNTFARNAVLLRPAATGELVKRGRNDANQQQKQKIPAPTLAFSQISPSPFGDMHGQ